MIDTSKLKAGDVVTIECEAVHVNDVDWPNRKSSDFDLPRLGDNYLRARRILSIEPRPIAVGGEVLHEGAAWKVLGIAEGMAWIREAAFSSERPPKYRSEMVAFLSPLTRADASDE